VTAPTLPIAVIGNGGAAAEAVLALRASGYAGEIHLFADNDHPPYNPMLGTYLVSGNIPLEQAFPFGDRVAFYDANRVTAHLNTSVAHLDAEARQLRTAGGDVFTYDRCLVASGARPSVPPIAGLRAALAAAGNGAPRRVFTLQTLADALQLKAAVDELLAGAGAGAGGNANTMRGAARVNGAAHRAGAGAAHQNGAATGAAAQPPRATVVGASFAGVKIAAVLKDLGFSVSLIEREASILPLAAHPEAARLMEAHLLREGYELRLGAALAGVTHDDATGRLRLDFGALPGAADPAGAGGTACDDSAAQDEADLLVVCTGNRPTLGFLAPGQVDMGAGILVDEQLRSNLPGLWAAGDVAQGKNLLSGRREIIGLWSNARYQGRAAGRAMCGAPSGYPGGLPHNITHVGRMLFASVGCVNDYDEVTVTRADPGWQVRLFQDGRLVGINLIDCCSAAGVIKQTLARVALGETSVMETTWTSFSG
jgi:NADPH-dependent 2,4-dienoyl-CoA reductase/sulfur reductase-like enzyme